jgi:hypothetical protein
LCGGYFDMGDLGAVLEHEEPLPHPACDTAIKLGQQFCP